MIAGNGPMSDTQPLMIPPVPGGVDAGFPDNAAQSDSVLSMLLMRWRTMLVVSVLVAAACFTAIWIMVRPKYEVSATIHVAPVDRAILFSDPNVDEARNYRQYMGTEAARILAAPLIEAALDAPGVRELPFVAQMLDPVATIQRELKVEHNKGTELLQIAMSGENPKDMVPIIDSILKTYLRQRGDRRRQSDERILGSLRKEDTELKAKLEIKARQLQQTAVDKGLGGAEPSGALVDTWIGDLQGLLTQAKKERALANGRLELLDTDMATGGSALVNPAELEIYLSNNRELQGLRQELRAIELAALNDHRFGRGPNHPDVHGRKGRVEALRTLVGEKELSLSKAFALSAKQTLLVELREDDITIRVLQDELDRLNAERSDLAGQLFVLETLRYERERLELSLNRVREKIWTVEVEQNRAARVTLASPARAPVMPNIDKRIKLSAAALLMSMFVGVATAILLGRLDTSFRLPEEVTERLGVRVLGAVQHLEDGPPIAIDRRLAEPMRGISMALLAGSKGKGARTRLITSPAPGSGKSSLAMNLARSLAATGRSVLLVDADNTGRGVSRALELADHPGMSELLEGTISAKEAMCSAGVAGLTVIPAGAVNDCFGEMLSSLKARELLHSLFAEYDEVIVDSPPVLATSDAAILATMIDEVVVVLRAGQTTREEAAAAQQSLAAVGGNVVGVILNAVDPKTSRYAYRYGYAYAAAT